jgi:CubicO group peptidase (beta-lactamase class C family)
MVANWRFQRNYQQIAAGKRSVIGCGPGACDGFTSPEEFNYFDPATHPFFRGRDVHSLQSVTKSVVATLVGIAIHRGELPAPSSPLLPLLNAFDVSRTDPRLSRATLADLLTMRSGIEWHEGDRPLDMTNTTVQLEWSRDWVAFTLSQPMDADPGTKWVYNSGGSHLLSAIVQSKTGMRSDLYAQRHLFGPLGIRDYHWKITPTGIPDGEGGLYLEAEQLAKIGLLYLNDGMWGTQRIFAPGWARTATTRHVERVNAGGSGYGYQWWRPDRNGVEVWAGMGFGGQYLLVLPAQRIVAVTNAWNVYGGRARGLMNPLIDALIAAAR